MSPGVGGRPAGGDEDLADALCQRRGQIQLWQADRWRLLLIIPAKFNPAGDGVGQRAHLFVDFFVHEVAVLALFGCHRIPGDLVGLDRKRSPFERLDGDAAAGNHGDLARFQEDHTAGVFEDRRQIRGYEHLVLTVTDHDPAGVANPGSHNFIGLARAEDHDPVGAFKQAEGLASSFDQAALG